MANVVEVTFRGIDEVTNSVNKIEGSVSRMGTTMAAVGRIAVGFFAVDQIISFAKAAAQASDIIQEQKELLLQYSDSIVGVTQVHQQLARVALETDTALASTFDTYVRLTQQASRLGLTERQRIDVVRTLNEAMQLAGPLAGEVNGILNRVLTTGEFNSRSLVQLFQSAPRLAKAMADELGVTVDKLKELGDQGKLTLDVLVNSLVNQSGAIRSDFEETGQTIAESMTNLGTAIGQVISKLDDRIGFTDTLARGLQRTADAILGSTERGEEEVVAELANVIERRQKLQERIKDMMEKQGVQPGDELPTGIRLNQQQLEDLIELELRLQAEKKALQESRAATAEKDAATRAAAAGEDLHAGKVGEVVRKLEEQVAVLGKSATATALYKLQMDGATQAQLEAAEAAMKTIEAFETEQMLNDTIAAIAMKNAEQQARYAEEAERVIDETLSAIANKAAEEQVRYAADAERIVNETIAGIEMKRLTEETERAAKAAELAWDQAVRNIQSVFAEELFNGFDDGLDGMLKKFIDVVRQMIAQALAAKLVEKLFGKAKEGEDGNGGGSILGGVLGAIFGGKRATGGDTKAGKVYQINEQQPEFLVSGDRGRVVPLSKMAANGFGVGGPTVYSPQTVNHINTTMNPFELEMYMQRRDDALIARFLRMRQDGVA